MAEAVPGREIENVEKPDRLVAGKYPYSAVVARIREGGAYADIAKQFDVSPATISKIAIESGIRKRTESPEPKPHIGAPGAKTAGAKAAETRAAKARDSQIITLFAVAFESLYSIIGQFEGKHWDLETDEADDLAKALKDALDTLEGEEYERAIKILSRVAPWASLGAALWVITKPRLEQTTRERAAKQAVERDRAERAANFGTVAGGENPRAYAEESFSPIPLGGDEQDGRTAWPDAE